MPELKPLDATALDESIASLSPLASRVKRTMIRIVMDVPAEDIDWSQCECEELSDRSDFWGMPATHYTYEINFDNATLDGRRIVEIDDSSYDSACDYLIDKRRSV